VIVAVHERDWHAKPERYNQLGWPFRCYPCSAAIINAITPAPVESISEKTKAINVEKCPNTTSLAFADKIARSRARLGSAGSELGPSREPMREYYNAMLSYFGTTAAEPFTAGPDEPSLYVLVHFAGCLCCLTPHFLATVCNQREEFVTLGANSFKWRHYRTLPAAFSICSTRISE